ncbi:phosphopantetheine-binding protein [Flavihumibacter stibioxidans]|uniref:Acyl carrier protein n=1 Tax=Flavihumibacter stibioxidans TaxID=1834163 RepID=A0ABR7MA06_9BACT|nr:phosphopantetheine-binding protein [Flavihumibacter stibioxidans]MBC6491883.1 acyl carrier protein [Flavihumibacter stibioxidans]
MNREQLVEDLKQQIIEQLNLQVKPEEIVAGDPLFNEGLGLDSIDALELIVLMQQKYRIKLANAEEGPKVFQSIDTMADYIIAHQPAANK